MRKFRLKKEAVPFFKEEHAKAIYDWSTWEHLQVDDRALEEVEDAYLSYGMKSGESSSSLCGWNAERGAEFNFTIHFPSVTYQEHDKFSKGRTVRDLMDRIQKEVNNFYLDFANKKTDQ